MTGTGEKQDTLFVASLEKAMRLLEAFNETRCEMGLSELAAASGLDKSATQRLASTFHRLGYLDKDLETRRFRPAVKFLELANAYLWADDLVRVAMPKLIDLRQVLGETVNLALSDGDSIVYTVRLPNARTSFGATIIGRRVPALNTSSGRAMLSLRKPEERRRCVEEWPMRRFTPNTLMDRPKILEAIEHAAETGYAIAYDELLLNEVGISAPVRNGRHAPAAIQCSVARAKWDAARIERDIVPHLLDAANSI